MCAMHYTECLLVGDGQTDGRPSPDSVGPKLCRELPHGGPPIRAEKYSEQKLVSARGAIEY